MQDSPPGYIPMTDQRSVDAQFLGRGTLTCTVCLYVPRRVGDRCPLCKRVLVAKEGET